MIVKHAEEATKCPVEKLSWELAAALFLSPEAGCVRPSFAGTANEKNGLRVIKLLDPMGRKIGYWRREP
jgi:hypothetical protein